MINGGDFKEDPNLGVLFSYSGALKIIATCRKHLENKLWFRFAESITMKEGFMLHFEPHAEFTEILINLKKIGDFKEFHRIIDIANDDPNLLFINTITLNVL